MNGDEFEPFWLSEEATPEDEMNSRYREVLAFFAAGGSPVVRRRLGVELCSVPKCGGVVIAFEARVPGAFRVDACCEKCGGSEVHRAGWLDRDARDTYRKNTRSKEVG
jgi:hypothetical protein